ncbi:dNA gyrase subunit A [Clostridium sp. CAG:354]|jgi:DNA gyrase, A subunit|nr:DNA gyrase subunit A [Clostridium sp.]MEE0269728.1 DNA gyrase subunit A [Clostridia bacterium]CDE10841.1 dNA gyrase subunit A [Clostridium sp. CAG:354]
MDNHDGKIIERDIENEMKTAYISYAMSVIVQRALPDVRDGLKPVHRRILYAMHEDGITSDKPYRKCANTVGSVLGRYHPHGDSSVYDAMVRMAQDFSLRYMLIDGHGNFGSIDGDGAAAMRYTEARMSKIAEYMLTDIEKNTVDFMPNYDDRLQEPTVLPSKIPQLLINGSSGIAVGMATNIPPHNLTEVCDGLIRIIENPNTTDEELMSIIKGPDFPTGGMILGKDGIKEAYRTGKGKIVVRAEAEIEEMANNKQRIIVTSLPYQVNKARLIENISKLVREKRIEGISELRDESDRNDRVRIVIELKRDARAQVVLNQLYKNTQMQDTFGAILLALVDGEPKILTLRQCLDYYIDHRKTVILRRTKFELDKALARAHILEGLRIAIDNIDEVISIIRSSYDDAKERLIERFGLTDIQAQAILDMRLKTLSGLQREKIEEEYKQLMELIAHLREILNNEQLVYDIIKEDLEEVKTKFGDERLTKIKPAEGDIEEEDLIKEEQTIVALTHFGYIKRMPADTYKSQRRGGKGITGISTRADDFVTEIFTASTHDTILFFSNKGKLYRLRGYEIPEAGRTAKGTAIVNLLSLDPGEKITAVIPISNFAEGKYLLMATQKGFIKKTALTEYNSARKTGLQAITLKEEDELIAVRLTDGQDNVVLVTEDGMSITFSEQDVRPMGRTAQGVIGIKLGDGDKVIGMESIIDGANATLLAITEHGFGKRTDLDEYRVQNRGGRGVITYKVTQKTGKLVGIRVTDDSNDIMMITDTGTIIRISVKDVSVLGRSTQGVTLMRTNDGGKVVSIELVEPEETNEE